MEEIRDKNYYANDDVYFMNIAASVSVKSTCVRRQIGAILVSHKHVLSTGYNGSPKGCKHCTNQDVGCLRNTLSIESGTHAEICRAVHAEQNAIIQCAVYGCSTKGATLYTTTQPCSICAKIIINAEIAKVVYTGDYPDKFALELLEEAGVQLVKL